MKPGLIISAALVTLLAEWAIANLALRITGVPKGFPPFTFLPILSGVAGGFFLASLAYAIIRANFSQPQQSFLFVAVITLAVSFALPLRLSFTKSKRFAGVTPAAQITLVLMHSLVAAAATIVLTRVPR
ncbi:MAG TPA: hypothetical protein VGG97_07260 [Bryobacteraceae bacterium]|jgi:hypothetical protein